MKTLIRKIIKKLQSGLKTEETMFIDKGMITKLLPENPVIIDCGAHIGADAIEWSKIPGSKIYAFEPVNNIFEQLERNTKDIPNVFRYNLALNDKDGEFEMFVSSGESDGSSSLLRPKMHLNDHPKVYFNEVEKIQAKTLDSWAIQNGVFNVDLLWLDMQGAEQSMLQASEVILETVKLIHTEVSVRETYEGVELYNNYKTFLESRGFKVLAEAIPKGYDMGNVLFIRN